MTELFKSLVYALPDEKSKTTDQVKVGIQMSIPESNDNVLIEKSSTVVVSNEKTFDKQLTNQNVKNI